VGGREGQGVNDKRSYNPDWLRRGGSEEVSGEDGQGRAGQSRDTEGGKVTAAAAAEGGSHA
jgi:hypothetical protein